MRKKKISISTDSKQMQKASVHGSDYVCGLHRLISDASKAPWTFSLISYLGLKLGPHPFQLLTMDTNTR